MDKARYINGTQYFPVEEAYQSSKETFTARTFAGVYDVPAFIVAAFESGANLLISPGGKIIMN